MPASEPYDIQVEIVDLGMTAGWSAPEQGPGGWRGRLLTLFRRLMVQGGEEDPPDFKRDDLSRFTRIVPPRVL